MHYRYEIWGDQFEDNDVYRVLAEWRHKYNDALFTAQALRRSGLDTISILKRKCDCGE